MASTKIYETNLVKKELDEILKDEPVINHIPDEVSYYKHFYRKVLHTGSRVIGGAHEDSDDDYVLLSTPELVQPLEKILLEEGFYHGGSLEYDDTGKPKIVDFLSLKKDNLNLILTNRDDFFDDFDKATRLAKKLRLVNKEDRVTLFKAIRDKIFPGDPEDKPEKQSKSKYTWEIKANPADWRMHVFDGLQNAVPPRILPQENPQVVLQAQAAENFFEEAGVPEPEF